MCGFVGVNEDTKCIAREEKMSLREELEKEKAKYDAVNSPAHYCQGSIECIEALAAATVNLKGIEAVCTANAIKYLWRWKEKNGVEDLRKARWYINYLEHHCKEKPNA